MPPPAWHRRTTGAEPEAEAVPERFAASAPELEGAAAETENADALPPLVETSAEEDEIPEERSPTLVGPVVAQAPTAASAPGLTEETTPTPLAAAMRQMRSDGRPLLDGAPIMNRPSGRAPPERDAAEEPPAHRQRAEGPTGMFVEDGQV